MRASVVAMAATTAAARAACLGRMTISPSYRLRRAFPSAENRRMWGVAACAAVAALWIGTGCSRQAERQRPESPDRWRDGRMLMVDEQLRARGIRDPRVLDAMTRVPRHLFVPDASRAEAYGDHPLPIGHGQTIS